MWSSWMINLIWSHTMICYLCIHHKSWRSHMIAQGNFNLNELQSSPGLKVSLLLMGCFIIWDASFVAQLIGNLVWLLPNGIFWWNTLKKIGNKWLQFVKDKILVVLNMCNYKPCSCFGQVAKYNQLQKTRCGCIVTPVVTYICDCKDFSSIDWS